jgi:Fic family protein
LKKRCKSSDELIATLKRRHALLMQGRPEMHPGEFKTILNQAGSTLFVAPDLVEGTLRKGFQWFQGLHTPFQRAVYMMFLIAEVHPFADGNGRCARVMMNAELVTKDQARIIIPTIFRNNYLSALKALTHQASPSARFVYLILLKNIPLLSIGVILKKHMPFF